jgi:hypothetical protein
MRGACLLSRHSEDVPIFFGRASVPCEDLLDTGSIKNCQRRLVEQFGGQNPQSKRRIQLLVKKLETKGTLLDLYGGGRPEMSENKCSSAVKKLKN